METKLAHIQVRNWGTIGGNLAHGDAAGDPAPVLIALGASLKLGNAKGTRVVALDEFYTDLFETALAGDEIVLEVQVPAPAAGSGTFYEKFNLLESDQGIVSVAASVSLDGRELQRGEDSTGQCCADSRASQEGGRSSCGQEADGEIAR